MSDESPVEPAKPAKKAPAKKAPAKKAPAKKAPAKRAPAKKAAAKRAPAKRSTGGTPRVSILNRIHELEERIAADAPVSSPPPRRRRASAPVAPPIAPMEPTPQPPEPFEPVVPVEHLEPQIAPVVEAEAPQPIPKPAKEPKAPRAEKVPRGVKTVRVTSTAPVVVELDGADEATGESLAVAAVPHESVPVEPITRVVPVPIAEDSGIRTARIVAGLIVLLLALAAGLGSAAVVKNRPATWQSQTVVTLTTPAGTDEDAVVDRLAKKVDTSGFAGLTAAAAGVRTSDVRELAKARRGGSGEVVVDLRASTADQAVKLAAAAGPQLLLTLATDQALLGDPDKRVTGAVTTAATSPERVKPTDQQAWLVGGLAGLAVLLIGVVAFLLMTTSTPRKTA